MKGHKRALITGISGQDGSYLAELLQEKGYEVFGISQDAESKNIFKGDLADHAFIEKVVNEVIPDEVYNFAGISDLGTATKNPELTLKVNFEAVSVLLNSAAGVNKLVRLFQAGSSQMFDTTSSPQNEDTSFADRNIYATSKIKAHQEIILPLRESGIFACTGFLFNHESPRRDERFVTRKITRTLSKIKLGLQKEPLEVGNVEMKRDWSFAGDFVNGAYMMLQAKIPEDYVLASGELHTVREFIEYAAKEVFGKNIEWTGSGVDERGSIDGKVIVAINKAFYQPLETYTVVGDISKIKKELGWQPNVSFVELVHMMVRSDLADLSK